MKCIIAIQTEVALQNIRYVSNLGPRMKKAWVWLEKIGFVLSTNIWYSSRGQKVSTFTCSVNAALEHTFSYEALEQLWTNLILFQFCSK